MKNTTTLLFALAMADKLGLLPTYKEPVKFEYCGNCPFLSVNEKNQKRGEKHICNKYNRQVFHMGRHPNIVRVPECDEPETKPLPYEVYKDFEQGQPFKDER